MTDTNNNIAIGGLTEIDDIYKNLHQVHSMLLLVYGGGMENFDECSATVRDNYIWACSDGIERTIALVDKLCGTCTCSVENKEVKS